jgi:CheY-like chemotaxis protein
MTGSGFVLVVEDELLIQDLVQRMLEDAGYAVETATTGAEALERLDARGPQFSGLVTDINLGAPPNGWDVARRARELNQALAVLYVSGDSAHGWAAHGVPRSLLVQKPFTCAEIVVALGELIGKTVC